MRYGINCYVIVKKKVLLRRQCIKKGEIYSKAFFVLERGQEVIVLLVIIFKKKMV